MTNTARVLWLVLLLNIAMIAGVLVYGLGNTPFDDIRGLLKWFTLGVVLSGMALTFGNMAGMDARNESVALGDASQRTVRLVLGVVAGGVLGVAAFVKGAIATALMLGGKVCFRPGADSSACGKTDYGRSWAMPVYVPKGFSQTDDFFAGVMVDAPEFAMNGMSVTDAFSRLRTGIDSVLERARNPEAKLLLQRCLAELSDVETMFHGNVQADPAVRKAARSRLQRAYYDLYRKSGQLLKAGVDIGPDDDI